MCLSVFYLFFFIVPLLCITPFIWVFNKGSKAGAICGAVTAYPSGAHRVHTRFLMWVRVVRSLVFCVMFCRWFNFCPVSLAIVLSVLLRFTLWYPQTFGHCVVSPSSIYPLVSSNFWPLCRLSFFDIPFGILKLLAIVLSLLFRFTLWHLQTFLTNGRHLSLNCLWTQTFWEYGLAS
jgi:hypothetical protein